MSGAGESELEESWRKKLAGEREGSSLRPAFERVSASGERLKISKEKS